MTAASGWGEQECVVAWCPLATSQKIMWGDQTVFSAVCRDGFYACFFFIFRCTRTTILTRLFYDGSQEWLKLGQPSFFFSGGAFLHLACKGF